MKAARNYKAGRYILGLPKETLISSHQCSAQSLLSVRSLSSFGPVFVSRSPIAFYYLVYTCSSRHGSKACIPSTSASRWVLGADPSVRKPCNHAFCNLLQLLDLTDIVSLNSSANPSETRCQWGTTLPLFRRRVVPAPRLLASPKIFTHTTVVLSSFRMKTNSSMIITNLDSDLKSN